jgi:outer membrane protein assembly factor BamE (lipoprotein component of BamABCDE complex)
MKFTRLLLAATLGITLLSGCAGTNFVRPEAGALVLGQSKQGDVAQKLGAPMQTGELTKNDKQLKVLKYAYAQSAGGEPLYAGVVPVRSMAFAFFNDTLVSQEFVSSFKADATDFDGAKVKQIVKGKSRKDDVMALLGKPSGEAVYPVVKSSDDRALVYSYTQAKGSVFNMKFHTKTLVVSYDRSNLVTDVEYSTSGDQ